MIMPALSYGEGYTYKTPVANQVIYGINAADFARGSNVHPFEAIQARLPELKNLGVDIVWLQPIFKSLNPDQGYETIDFFQISPEVGSGPELKALIGAAHAQGLKIILDVTLNHTSQSHLLATDVAQRGQASPYYDFYQHEIESETPYSQYMHERQVGQSTFVYYFWPTLFNLNYNNPQVRRYALSVLKYWMKKFDIDGYRFDAAWGPSSRWPEFYKTMSDQLRTLKPNAVLIAEDKAGYPEAYADSRHPHFGGSSFDAAYDWTKDRFWVSKWSFQNGDRLENTVFNTPDAKHAAQLFKEGLDQTAGAQVSPLRYIENNDTPSFNTSHNQSQTALASKLMLTLPGTPLLFYGQEVGATHQLYQLPSFDPSRSMRSYNPQMWDEYQKLIAARKSAKATNQLSDAMNATVNDSQVICENLLAMAGTKVTIDFSNATLQSNDLQRSQP